MQIRAVVALGEAVEEDLPVALQLGVESVDLVRPGKGIALDAMGQVAEVIAHRLGVVGVEIDEDEPFPDFALNRRHPAAVGIEVQQQILSGGGVQRAVQLVTPAMEAAVQQGRPALHLLEGVVLPQHLVAAVWADVVQGADHTVLAAHDDDRGVEEFQFAGEVAAGLRHSLDAAHVEPGLLEDVLTFLLVELL